MPSCRQWHVLAGWLAGCVEFGQDHSRVGVWNGREPSSSWEVYVSSEQPRSDKHRHPVSGAGRPAHEGLATEVCTARHWDHHQLTGGRCQVCLVISQEAAARCVQLLLTGGCSQVASSDWTPCPLVDSIWTIMFVWRLKEKSVRTVVCCVCCVWQLYTMIHTCEQFLQLIVDVGFFLCVFSHGLNFLCEYGYFVFCVLLLSFISSVLVNRLARKNMSEIT